MNLRNTAILTLCAAALLLCAAQTAPAQLQGSGQLNSLSQGNLYNRANSVTGGPLNNAARIPSRSNFQRTERNPLTYRAPSAGSTARPRTDRRLRSSPIDRRLAFRPIRGSVTSGLSAQPGTPSFRGIAAARTLSVERRIGRLRPMTSPRTAFTSRPSELGASHPDRTSPLFRGGNLAKTGISQLQRNSLGQSTRTGRNGIKNLRRANQGWRTPTSQTSSIFY